MTALLSEERKAFHVALARNVLARDQSGIPSNADGKNTLSVKIATGILDNLGNSSVAARLVAQTSGSTFEEVCANFISLTFLRLGHLRPGKWQISRGGGKTANLASFEQYAHLADLRDLAKKSKELRVALGSDYLIRPDIVIARLPEPDETINAQGEIVDAVAAKSASIRSSVNSRPILHGSISCKWTIRSDRSQNSRSEALNLIRNRKGRVPHIAVITGEPMPSRLSSIALGTGDIDCVYHFALYELRNTLLSLGDEGALDMLQIMIDGARLKDISDLPLDLTV